MIRSVTLGLPINDVAITTIEETVRSFQLKLRGQISQHRWPIRTARITLPPVETENKDNIHLLRSTLESISRLAESTNIRWFCVPVNLIDGANTHIVLPILLDSLTRLPSMFINLMISDEQTISMSGASSAADFILKVAKKTNNGFDNFRVGVSCGCGPNAPFFPFSRHYGENFRFSLALETTDLAIDLSTQVISKKMGLAEFHGKFVSGLVQRLVAIDEFGQKIEELTGVEFAGLDASLAPFPNGRISIGLLLQNLGASPIGGHGTTFLTSLLTDAVRTAVTRSGVLACGFNGVMFSVLEDNYLAKANSLRQIDITALSLFSTVCGCGIDMVPIPGNTFAEDIASIYLDTAALSVKLHKPLGVRLLPIPGKEVNESTNFNLDFLCDSRVMSIKIGEKSLCDGEGRWQYASAIKKSS